MVIAQGLLCARAEKARRRKVANAKLALSALLSFLSNPGSNYLQYTLIKKAGTNPALLINGDRAGIRTLDLLIKSQLLYQLSYAIISS